MLLGTEGRLKGAPKRIGVTGEIIVYSVVFYERKEDYYGAQRRRDA